MKPLLVNYCPMRFVLTTSTSNVASQSQSQSLKKTLHKTLIQSSYKKPKAFTPWAVLFYEVVNRITVFNRVTVVNREIAIQASQVNNAYLLSSLLLSWRLFNFTAAIKPMKNSAKITTPTQINTFSKKSMFRFPFFYRCCSLLLCINAKQSFTDSNTFSTRVCAAN